MFPDEGKDSKRASLPARKCIRGVAGRAQGVRGNARTGGRSGGGRSGRVGRGQEQGGLLGIREELGSESVWWSLSQSKVGSGARECDVENTPNDQIRQISDAGKQQ